MQLILVSFICLILLHSALSERVWCSSHSGCQISGDNLIAVNNTLSDEVSCQAWCADTASCELYSWFLSGECWLLTSCGLPDLTCDCWTGPKECPVTSTPDPQNSSSISSCQAPPEKENGDWFCYESDPIHFEYPN